MKIESAEHAVLCLQSWVEEGKKLLATTTDGPWAGDPGTDGYDIVAYTSRLSEKKPWIVRAFIASCQGQGRIEAKERLGNKRLLVSSRSLVPGMIKGMEAVLEEYNKWRRKQNTAAQLLHPNTVPQGKILVALANAYLDDMVEAGFEVPSFPQKTKKEDE